MNDEEIEKIAEDHWMWVEGLLQSMPEDTVFSIEAIEYLYTSAFVHGWKHALQKEVKDDQKRKNTN